MRGTSATRRRAERKAKRAERKRKAREQSAADKAIPAPVEPDGPWTVKVRLVGEVRAQRLTPDGRTTGRKVHAAMIADRAKAEAIASQIESDRDDVVKAWVERF